VRLTRWGRAVAQALLITAALLTVLGVAAATQASSEAPPATGVRPSVVVHSGDTLWSIAARYAPDSDHGATMREIRRLNNLKNSRIEVGQKLLLPPR
jgi:LysM repeat protein